MFYGWIIVGVAFFTIMSSMGIWYTFSVFYVEILQEFGWSRAATAGVFMVYATVHGLAAPVVGMATRRWGSRVVISVGNLIMVLGLVLSSQTSAVWHLFVFYGCVVAAGGSAMGYPPNGAVIANWFSRKRGLAMGVAFAGTGAGLFVFPKLSQQLIDAFGWRHAYLYLSLVVLALVLPLNTLLSRYRPEEKGLTVDGLPEGPTPDGDAPRAEAAGTGWTLRRSLRSSPFWLIGVSYGLSALVLQIVMMHQFAFMTDIGVTRSFAAGIISAVGLANICGQLMSGSLCDRVGSETAFSVHGALLIAALLVLMLLAQTRFNGGLYLYPLLWGLGAGGVGLIVLVASAEIFQGPNFAVIAGYHSFAWGLGGGVGSILAGWIFDLTSSYSIAFLVAILFTLVAIASIWFAEPRAFRRARLAHTSAPDAALAQAIESGG